MSYRSRAAPTSSGYTKKTTTEKNQQILKSLLKDPANKVCADCKASGHPRWTSWSLGIFICISGQHRGPPSNINKPTPTIPQQQKQQPSASLIGLDFSSPISAAPAPAPGARPTPTASGVTPAQNSRPDLKKSILSLYAAAPTPQPVYNPPQQLQHNFNNGINNLTSLTGNLSINNNTSMNNNSFNTNSSFASPTATRPAAKASSAFDDLLSGGAQNWVNSGTKQTKPVSANTNTLSQPTPANNSNGWGNISTSTATTAASTKKNGLDDDIFGNVWK